jgi:2-oxoglutarate ferredoxin oxidoreductase subunit alpha
MPTSVEQSDLNIACFGAHGDSPRVVIAPANVEDCFYTGIEAVNIAKKYSVPVIILTDQAISTRIEAFPMPDLEKVVQDISPTFEPQAEFEPYDLDAVDGITNHQPPGTRIESGKYPVITGLEHNEMGHPTSSPVLHTKMQAKRRRKLQKLASELPLPEVYGPNEGNVILVGWGSTQGSMREAVERARESDDSISCITMRHIMPMPDGLESIFDGFHHVYVVETNDEGLNGYGQLCGLMRAKFCDPKIEGINKTDGLTWRVHEILKRVKEKLEPAKE